MKYDRAFRLKLIKMWSRGEYFSSFKILYYYDSMLVIASLCTVLRLLSSSVF